MAKQRRNFRITYSRREGNGSDNEGNEWLFDKLDAERTDRPLGPRQLFFAAAGSDTHTFLINLKKKATAKFVKQVLGRALGPDYGYSVDLVETAKKGEKFVPGEREAEGRCRSTIEREAIEAGGESSASFVLVDASHRTTYSYDGRGGLSRLVREPRLPRDVDAGATKDSPQGRATVVSSAQEAQEHRQPGPSSNTGGDERGGSSATATARDQRQPTGTTSGGSHVDATSAPRSGRSGGREQEQHEQDIIETSQQSGSKRATNASPAPDDRRRADRPTGGDKATKRARKSAPKRPPVEPPSVNGTQGATSATGPLPNVDKAQPSQTGIACDDGGGDDDDSAKNGTIDPMPVDAGANRACGARRETGACAAPGPAGDGEGVSTQGSGGGGEGGGEAARGCCGGGVEGGGEAARGCSGGGGSRSGRGRGADGGSGGRDVDGGLSVQVPSFSSVAARDAAFEDKAGQWGLLIWSREVHHRDSGGQQPGRHRHLDERNSDDVHSENGHSNGKDRHQDGGARVGKERADEMPSDLEEGGGKTAGGGAFGRRKFSSSVDLDEDLETLLLMSFSANGPLHPRGVLADELQDRECYYCGDESAVWPPARVIVR